ncbi:MAG: cytidine deaminase [Oscillospiraceae bacterium]
MNEKIIENLISKALNAETFAYNPYSKFSVGSALLCKDGEIFTGCNIENSSFSGTICAERVAFSKAISSGEKNFSAICVTGILNNKNDNRDFCTPCGICRQFMAEFCDENFIIIVAKNKSDYKCFTLKQLLPESFDF